MTLLGPVAAPVPGVQKIAVLRANALGDFIVTLPGLDALRQGYPGAEIVLLGSDLHRLLLHERPSPVDRVIVVPPSRGVRNGPEASEQELARFFAAMRAERFDLVLQFHGGGRHSNPFVRRLGARVTVGSKADDAIGLDRSLHYAFHAPEILRFVELAALAGAPPVTLEPRLAVTERDLAEVADALRGVSAPFAVLHPGAVDRRRRWPSDRFAAVGDALARAGATVVLTGAGEDGGLVDELAEAMREPAFPLAGKLSLGGLVGLLARSVLLVGNDSGPRHVAEAVGTRTVAVYWVGNMITTGPLTRARHRPAVAWTVQCPVCGRNHGREQGGRCDHDPSFVADVPVEEVLRPALELLTEAVAEAAPRRLAC